MRVAKFPPPLVKGDRVGVAALSGPVEASALQAGFDTLCGLGLRPVLASNLSSSSGLFAGRDAERLDAFMTLAADPALKAIFFARGGHGILRVLPGIDWSLLARFPRAYIGYSDVTPFLNLVVDRLGLVALHGPMVAVECAAGLEKDERESLWNALSGTANGDIPVEGATGSARGVLKGGCLSLLAATAGTELAPDLGGAVLFWEDVAEPLFRLDRMLTQLRLSGSLAGIKAMVAGRIELLETDPVENDVSILLEEFSREIGCPSAWGLASGHCRPNFTLPLGAEVFLDSGAGIFRFET
jgi:muramoyltetrapeptide carboxypeptidase